MDDLGRLKLPLETRLLKGLYADVTWVAMSSHTGTVQSKHAPWQKSHGLMGIFSLVTFAWCARY